MSIALVDLADVLDMVERAEMALASFLADAPEEAKTEDALARVLDLLAARRDCTPPGETAVTAAR